jgi:CRISPR-associated endonuclease/helicase Cas3
MGEPIGEAAVAAFSKLTKHKPYQWQERLLLGWFLRGRLPDAVDVPTGLGKTAVIALWLVAFAAKAALPRRLIYVVDRRTVVDQATEEADALAYALGDGEEVDDTIGALRRGLGVKRGQQLPVSTLRGQHLDNRLWLENPAAPAIVVGTVDMIGSRLLFEGYGVSPRMRPVHAGLLGADALVVLDEAHLVPPFEALLRAIAREPATAPVPGFHLMTLSATGRTRGSDTFSLVSEDAADEPVRARLNASKRLRLLDLPTGGDLTEVLADRAFELGGDGKRVLIFCDSRAAAQKVGERLAKKVGKDGALPELLVGARRVHERERLKDRPVFKCFDPKAQSQAGDVLRPVFLIATSAGEVGVDLDADHMVCDLVPWERMVQRLGRVNRRERPGESLIDVFAASENDAEAAADAERLTRWRAPFESPAWPPGADGRRDASPGMLQRLRDDPALALLLEQATTREPLRPALTRALLDAWSMTSLQVHPGRPDVEPWLRGWVEAKPQTRLVWRSLLPVRPDDDEKTRRKTLAEFFQYVPPHMSEILETLTSEVVDTLQKRLQALVKSRNESTIAATDLPLIGAVILSARGEVDDILSFEQLAQLPARQLYPRLAGRAVVVDARMGGLALTGLLDPKAEDLPATLDGKAEEWGPDLVRLAGFRVCKVSASAERDPGWLIEWRWRVVADDDSEDGEEITVEVWRDEDATSGDPAIARVAQTLAHHHDWTASEADGIARRLKLSDEYRRLLVTAAAVHDAGKDRELWQRAMRAPREGRPYAKTTGGGVPGMLEVNGQTYRHEFGSLRDAVNDPTIQALPEELRDLALHLIAAHHGYVRPVIAAVDPDQAHSASVELARAAVLRFAQLQARWGPWGLAWWEALVRAADWAASRRLNERTGSA